jgi:hypothetical protein
LRAWRRNNLLPDETIFGFSRKRAAKASVYNGTHREGPTPTGSEGVMTKSKKFLTAAVLTGFALSVAGLTVASLNTTANASAGSHDVVADRIGAAFASLDETSADPAIEAAAARVAKGDLEAKPGCGAATWPNISSDCLLKADGTVAPQVRTVTVGYQEGESTTILMRVPAPEVASR